MKRKAQKKNNKRIVGISLLFIGLVLIGIGIGNSVNPFAIQPLEVPEDGVPIDTDDTDDDGTNENFLYVVIGGYGVWLLLSDDNNSVYYNGQWYLIPQLQDIIDGDYPDEEEFDIDIYIDEHIPDDQQTDTPYGGYDEKNIPSYPFYAVGVILSIPSIFLIVGRRRPHINKMFK